MCEKTGELIGAGGTLFETEEVLWALFESTDKIFGSAFAPIQIPLNYANIMVGQESSERSGSSIVMPSDCL